MEREIKMKLYVCAGVACCDEAKKKAAESEIKCLREEFNKSQRRRCLEAFFFAVDCVASQRLRREEKSFYCVDSEMFTEH